MPHATTPGAAMLVSGLDGTLFGNGEVQLHRHGHRLARVAPETMTGQRKDASSTSTGADIHAMGDPSVPGVDCSGSCGLAARGGGRG
eukprot:jgi/Tetstr1/456510/TSEL_043232.t1